MSQERLPATILPSQLRFTPYTTYYNSYFLLRTPVTISGQPAEIGYSQSSELTLNSRYPNLCVTFHSISSNLETILKKYGVSYVSNFWCEQVPLFQVNFSSEYKLRKFLLAQQRVQSELASLFSAKLAEHYPAATPRAPPRDISTTVQTQLFLISPDAVKKDARVVAVKLENHSTCMTLWKESELFDFGALFRVYRLDPSKLPQQGEVELKDLVNELYEVTNWFYLGVHMDVPDPELFAIRHNYRDIVDKCKMEMLIWRMNQSPLTWSDVVRALVGIKMGNLARKIALKYGVMVPPVIERCLLQDTVLGEKVSSMDHQLASRIQQMTQEVGVHDNELTTIEDLLDQSRKEKAFARSKHVRGKNNLTTACNKTRRLLHERREVKQQLKLKEKELQYLQYLQKQQEENEDLRAIIEAKKGEIMLLRESLDGLRQDLETSREEANSLREQLHQSTTELAEKSADVRQLERTRADLRADLESERRRVDQLLMQSAATVIGEIGKEVKCQLASAKEQYDSQFRDMESHREAITQKEEEIRGLSEEVQTLEAQLHEVLRMQTSEDDVEEKLHRLTVETSDLRLQLAEAKGEKLEAVRRLEGVQREKREMEQWIAELEEKGTLARVKHCPRRIDESELVVQEELGIGTLAVVRAGIYRPKNGEPEIKCAIKCLKPSEDLPYQRSEILQEADIMAMLDHPNVVRLYGICVANPIRLVMEIGPLGPLKKFLRRHPSFPVLKIMNMMVQVAEGMEYLETLRIVHRELASRNVLVVDDDNVKISDSGLYRLIETGNEYYTPETVVRWPWYAPESIYYAEFDSKSDVWCYGITVWEAFSYGAKPYSGMKGQDVMQMLEHAERLDCPEKCPQPVFDIMLKCWSWRPEDRPAFSDLASHMKDILTYMQQESHAPIPPPRRIDESELVVQGELGGGTFATVVAGIYRPKNGEPEMKCTIKCLKPSEDLPNQTSEILQEAGIMAMLDHPNIVRLYGICMAKPIGLVMEIAPLGCLDIFLRTHLSFPILKIMNMMVQVAEGMQYLETVRIVHRYLAAGNVLVFDDDNVKISNFGMSRAIETGNEYYRPETAGPWPLKWYAPECIYDFTFNSKSDVWSYGVTVWEAFSYGSKPYSGMKGQDIMEMLEHDKRLDCPEKCPQPVFDIMLKCWSWRPEDRPTFSDLASRVKDILACMPPIPPPRRWRPIPAPRPAKRNK